MKPLISLIVVTYNSAEELPALFAALAGTRYAPYEVIVVDNASTDSTVADLAAYPARVVPSPTNLGFGRACNLGARQALGEYLVFLNPDVEATPDWLDILVEHAQARPRAILCPATLYPGQAAPSAGGAGNPLQAEAAIPGCALMLSRAWWRELGGFDEAMFLYWEDTELCWRSWLLGGEVLADRAAIVYHQRGVSTGFRRWDDELIKNSLYTHLKLLRWRRVLPFAALLAAKTLVKSLRYRQPGLWAAWWWNLRHLGATLQARRQIAQVRQRPPGELEVLIDAHTRIQARQRRERNTRATTPT